MSAYSKEFALDGALVFPMLRNTNKSGIVRTTKHNTHAIDASVLTLGLACWAIAETIDDSLATCFSTLRNVSLTSPSTVSSYPLFAVDTIGVSVHNIKGPVDEL
jgi:hypothetical protein